MLLSRASNVSPPFCLPLCVRPFSLLTVALYSMHILLLSSERQREREVSDSMMGTSFQKMSAVSTSSREPTSLVDAAFYSTRSKRAISFLSLTVHVCDCYHGSSEVGDKRRAELVERLLSISGNI